MIGRPCIWPCVTDVCCIQLLFLWGTCPLSFHVILEPYPPHPHCKGGHGILTGEFRDGNMTRKRSDSSLRFHPWMVKAESPTFSQLMSWKRLISCLWPSFLAPWRNPCAEGGSETNMQRQENQAEVKDGKTQNNLDNNFESLDLAMLKIGYPWVFQLSPPNSLFGLR